MNHKPIEGHRMVSVSDTLYRGASFLSGVSWGNAGGEAEDCMCVPEHAPG
jgi:hypothetical protein